MTGAGRAVGPTGERDARDEQLDSAEGLWLRVIGIVSVVVVAAVLFLIYGPRHLVPGGSLAYDVSALPHANALLNGTSACLLLLGFTMIRRGRVESHRRAMLGAFAASSAFLVTYLVYHALKPAPRAYDGGAPWLYYPILLSHIVLAATVVPLALTTLYRGWHWRTQVERHRRLARITLPLWLYVSVTGVLIWAMLYL